MVKTLVLLVSFTAIVILLISTLAIVVYRRENGLTLQTFKQPSPPTTSPQPVAKTIPNPSLPSPILKPQTAPEQTLVDFGALLTGSDESYVLSVSDASPLPTNSPLSKSIAKLKSSPTPTPLPRLAPTPSAAPSSQTTTSASLNPSQRPSPKPLVIQLPVETTPLPQEVAPPATSRRGLTILAVGAVILTGIGFILFLKR